MNALERSHMLRVRMTDEEMRMLRELADADGVSASDVVRLYVRREHVARFGDQGKKPKPRR